MWTGDLALGEAVVELLQQELSKRGVSFRVVEKKWSELEFARLLGESAETGVLVEVEVDEKFRDIGEECLTAVYSDVKRLKETAVKIAMTKYIKDKAELEEYRKGLDETY